MAKSEILDSMYGYMDDVLQGRIPVSEMTYQYVKRQEDDLSRAARGEIRGAYGVKYVFDEEKVEGTIRFMQLFDIISGAEPLAKITLMPWQRLFMGILFGWVTDDELKLRRFRKAFLSIARQNGKTMMAALVALRCFIGDREGMSQVFACGGDKEQARIMFNRAFDMLDRRPDIRTRYKIEMYRSDFKGIQRHDEYGGTFKPLSRDMGGSLDGRSVSCAVVDEMHAHNRRDTWDAMGGGTGARSQPLILGVTTAGDDPSGIAKAQYQTAKRIFSGDEEDDSYLACIYEVDEGFILKDDIYREEVWRMACPSYDVMKPREKYVSDMKKAKADAGDRHTFKTKLLNVWSEPSIGWMNMVRFNQCVKKDLKWEFFLEGRIFLGMDLSSTTDLTAVAFTKWEDGKYYCKVSYWMSETAMRSERMPLYQNWHERKMLNICPGDTIDYAMIEGFILKHHRDPNCEIGLLCYDKYQALSTINRLRYEGVEVAEFHQNPSHYHPLMQALHKAVLDGEYVHDGNDVTEWCFGNAILKKSTTHDYYMPIKDPAKKLQRIDGVQASLMSMVGAIKEAEDVGSGPFFASSIPK